MLILRNASYERARQVIGNGVPVWAHWLYEPDEWKAFIETDLRQAEAEKRQWLRLIVIFGLLVGFAIGATGLMIGGAGVAVAWLWPVVALGGAIAAFAVWLSGSKKAVLRELEHGPQEVTVTPVGITIGEKYVPLVERGLALTRVWVSSKHPEVLRFRSEPSYEARGFFTRPTLGGLRYRKGLYEIWVPIPTGKEAEAEELAEQFMSLIVRPGGLVAY